jgi:hypothetical protein
VSTVIFFGLVVMWAVVLIPMWLRRHDEVEESRSIDRFTSAMHTLSRREPASDQRYVVMPHRSRSVDVHVSGAPAPSRRKQRKALAARRAAARPPVSAAVRRRRTLLGLLAVTIVTFALAMVVGGTVLWAVQLISDALLLGFVGYLVLLGRRAAQVHSARSARPARSAPAPTRRAPIAAPAASTRYAAYADDVEAVRVAAPVGRREPLFDQTVVAEAEPEPALAQPAATQPVAAEYVFDQSAIDVERSAPAATVRVEPEPEPMIDLPAYEQGEREPEIEIGGRPWEPVPVPRPTYSTKPTAPPRRPRAPIFEPLLPPVEPAAELDPVDDLEEILDRRWAVND